VKSQKIDSFFKRKADDIQKDEDAIF